MAQDVTLDYRNVWDPWETYDERQNTERQSINTEHLSYCDSSEFKQLGETGNQINEPFSERFPESRSDSHTKSDFSTQNIDCSTRNTDYSTSNIDCSARNIDCSTRNIDCLTNIDYSTQNIEYKTQSIDLSSQNIQSSHHIDSSTQNINLSKQNVDLFTQNVDYSTQDVDYSQQTIDFTTNTCQQKCDHSTSKQSCDNAFGTAQLNRNITEVTSMYYDSTKRHPVESRLPPVSTNVQNDPKSFPEKCADFNTNQPFHNPLNKNLVDNVLTNISYDNSKRMANDCEKNKTERTYHDYETDDDANVSM